MSESGVLVFGTLHTSSAAKTLTRVLDMAPEETREQRGLERKSAQERVREFRASERFSGGVPSDGRPKLDRGTR